MSIALREFTKNLFCVLCVVIVVAWCCAISGCQVAPVHEYCSVAKPITVHCVKGDDGKLTCRKYDADHDYLTPDTEREILTHDQTYSTLCKKKI